MMRVCTLIPRTMTHSQSKNPRKDKLAEALRQNLLRRKAATRPEKGAQTHTGNTPQALPEKPQTEQD